MKARIMLALIAVALAAGCGSASTSAPAVTVTPFDAKPSGAQQVTTAAPTPPTVPASGNADCSDAEASLRPGPLPAPGAMPPGSTMATIFDRRGLIVGVDQDTDLFGSRNANTGQLEGFDIDVAGEIARSIFGDPDHVKLRVIDAAQRESVLQSGEVDLVVRTYSITCARKDLVDFSTTYFHADQKILTVKGSGIDSAASLSGKRVCAVSGTTSLSRLFALDPRPVVFGAATWTDCLVMLQQGQVDAISTDDSVLAGLKLQDPNLEIVGASMAPEPYGIGVKKENGDLVRFVNGVLTRMRADGTWERLYNQWLLKDLGPSPGPPVPRYKDGP
jgi:polar amino acid transport system substrate-binding protein